MLINYRVVLIDSVMRTTITNEVFSTSSNFIPVRSHKTKHLSCKTLISTNNIAIGMLRGLQVRFQSTKIRLPLYSRNVLFAIVFFPIDPP
jgi:hypothetical protein